MSGSDVALLAGAYLVGSLSFGLGLVWLLRRVDVRTLGSGNPGATNVLFTTGRWPALLVLLLDIGKGLLPVVAARRLGSGMEMQAGAGLAAMVGHVFPIYFGFRGGKGVATALGVFLGVAPLAGGAALVVWGVTLIASRYVALASVVAAAGFPPLYWAIGRAGLAPAPSTATLVVAALGAALIVARHRSNLERIAAGTERRLGGRRKETE